MPESDSAASQIAEEKHKGEKQMKVRKKRERKDRQEKEEFERLQRRAKCLKMVDVRSQRRRFLAIGLSSVANYAAKAEASQNMECDRSLKYGDAVTQRSVG